MVQHSHAFLNILSLIGLIVCAFAGLILPGLIVIGLANVAALSLSCASEEEDDTCVRVTPATPERSPLPRVPDLPQ